MKKVWLYKRKAVKGWWVGWYESGKLKTRLWGHAKMGRDKKTLKYKGFQAGKAGTAKKTIKGQNGNKTVTLSVIIEYKTDGIYNRQRRPLGQQFLS